MRLADASLSFGPSLERSYNNAPKGVPYSVYTAFCIQLLRLLSEG